MRETTEHPRTVVLADVRDEHGAVWRAVTLNEDGSLVISGHDLGIRVEGVFGCSEYEFVRRLSPEAVRALRELLAATAGADLLPAITDRFPSGSGLEAFIRDHGFDSQFWSRVGD